MADIEAIPHVHVTRRRFLGGMAAATAAGATLAIPQTAQAASSAPRTFPKQSGPKAITQFVDAGEGLPDPFRFIHWLLPGPDGATTPILGLGSFGLDADPSTVGDFYGFTAYAVVAGTATGGDGEPYDVEFDVRVMQGNYVGEDGKEHYGTFAFF